MNMSMMGRLTALMSSVMDLHVRIALQEADREKRRLIGAGVVLGAAFSLLLLALVVSHFALLLWLHQSLSWSWQNTALLLAAIDLVLAGLLLRIGGRMMKGPFLPQTTAGLVRTTRALTGKL